MNRFDEFREVMKIISATSTTPTTKQLAELLQTDDNLITSFLSIISIVCYHKPEFMVHLLWTIGQIERLQSEETTHGDNAKDSGV